MSLKKDVGQTRGLEHAHRPGLQALRPGDRARVRARSSRALAGSVDLGESLRLLLPNEARWDYVVARVTEQGDEALHWIEVHPATGSGVFGDVARKAEWLLAWLSEDGRRLNRLPRRIVWVASGKAGFQRNAPQPRRLSALGVEFVGERHDLEL